MWEKVYSISREQVSKTFPINYEFTSNKIIVSANSGSASTNWRRAGYLYPTALVPVIGQVKFRSYRLNRGSQLLNMTEILTPYFLEYEFLPWYLEIDLDIWIES